MPGMLNLRLRDPTRNWIFTMDLAALRCMSALGVLVFWLAAWPLPGHANEDSDVINVMNGNMTYPMQLALKNGTDKPAVFALIEDTCIEGAPPYFTVNPGETWSATVIQRHYDQGVDNCYATPHGITYQDASNLANTFSVRQFDNSGDPNCYDIKFNIVFWINQAVCPVMTGMIAGPVSTLTQPDRITGRPGRVTDCPGGMDWCIGVGFGFYLSP